MTDQRSDAPQTGPGENPELRDEKDARNFGDGAKANKNDTAPPGDDGETEDLPDEDGQDWEEQEAIRSVSEGGDDATTFDDGLSDGSA